MHPFMDHILKLNTGQGSIYISNSQIIHLFIYFSTFSLKIFFSNIVQLYAMFHYTKESDSMIFAFHKSFQINIKIKLPVFMHGSADQEHTQLLKFNSSKRSPNLLSKGFCLDTCIGVSTNFYFFPFIYACNLHFVVSNVIHHHNNDLFIWNSMTLQNLIGMANISLKQGKIIIILGIPSVIVLNGMQILLIVSQFIWLFAFFLNTYVFEFQLLQI